MRPENQQTIGPSKARYVYSSCSHHFISQGPPGNATFACAPPGTRRAHDSTVFPIILSTLVNLAFPPLDTIGNAMRTRPMRPLVFPRSPPFIEGGTPGTRRTGPAPGWDYDAMR